MPSLLQHFTSELWDTLAILDIQISTYLIISVEVRAVKGLKVSVDVGCPENSIEVKEVEVQVNSVSLQANPQASLSMSLAQTDYCRQQGFDPQSPLCAHIILSGSVMEVQLHSHTHSHTHTCVSRW